MYLQLLVLASVAIININAIVKDHSSYIAISLILLLAALFSRCWKVLHYAILLFFVSMMRFIPFTILDIPGIEILIPLLISTFIISFFPKATATLAWLNVGYLDRLSITLMVITSFIASCMLIIWGFWSDNLGVGIVAMKALSTYPHWIILSTFIPAFALINSFIEEAVYRGIMQDTLTYILNNRHILAIALQASAFAAAHVTYGFPNGKVGYLMTFSYGCILGYLREKTKGIYSPFLTHVAADLIIGYFLYFMIF